LVLKLFVGGLAVLALLLTVRLVLLARQSKTPHTPKNRTAETVTELSPCPNRPNCVSSVEPEGSSRRVEPFEIDASPETIPDALAEAVGGMPGARIVTNQDGYLHAEFTSRVFGFVDDLELLLDETTGLVHVRSASRAGHSDLGANRRRVEALRARLARAET